MLRRRVRPRLRGQLLAGGGVADQRAVRAHVVLRADDDGARARRAAARRPALHLLQIRHAGVPELRSRSGITTQFSVE